MSTASFPRHARGASAGSDQPSPSPSSHLALVHASSAMEAERLARTPQEAFCARLRSARERRGVSIRAVAEATKVSRSLFERLELGDISRWPKGIYKRSFFRGYVAAIGLPADSTVDEFLRLFPDEQPASDAQPVQSPAEPGPAAAPLRLTLAPDAQHLPLHRRMPKHAAVDAAIVFLMTLVLVWWAQLDARIGAAILALCSYPHAARLVRHHASRHRRERLQDGARPQPADGLRHEAAQVTATAVS